MNLTLTSRKIQIIIEEKTLTLKDGIEVEYYGMNFKELEEPIGGTIREYEEGKFRIELEEQLKEEGSLGYDIYIIASMIAERNKAKAEKLIQLDKNLSKTLTDVEAFLDKIKKKSKKK